MNEIAARADVTKRTVYAYFTGKEDLYYAILTRWYETLLAELTNAATGIAAPFERIERGSVAYANLYARNPALFQLINERQSLGAPADESAPNRAALKETKKRLFFFMTETFEAARTEGSVRTDIAVSALVASFIFNLTGFFSMLSVSGDDFVRYFNLDGRRFIDSSVAMIVDGLRKERMK